MPDATSVHDRPDDRSRSELRARSALSPAAGPPTDVGQPWARGAVVLAASLLLGGLTSFAQGFLPDAAAPFANSASGWTLLTALLVAWAARDLRTRTWHAAVLGAASFVLLTLGYTVAADLRGFFYDPTLFGVVGLVVGPFVGVAAAWLWRTGVHAALGTALLAGIGVGESVYGLTTVVETTGATYWVVIGLASLVLLAAVLARRLRGTAPVALAAGGTVVVATAFVLAYRALGTIG
ncbi:DUF6518 family protein [Cellulosimicrobium cellulans]|uniref:DUF6518 family protein n=1 Tax=Cellulosimicrobium cellulans TaxID=1710 RepID=UPI002404BAA7|nr:DUF6518 family protein [Cellulosimicrobium cellulans]MDF9875076.1 uncharacterized membrane protein YhaH (DUF805 family) [Cellulosimicrobium cellulans]